MTIHSAEFELECGCLQDRATGYVAYPCAEHDIYARIDRRVRIPPNPFERKPMEKKKQTDSELSNRIGLFFSVAIMLLFGGFMIGLATRKSTVVDWQSQSNFREAARMMNSGGTEQLAGVLSMEAIMQAEPESFWPISELFMWRLRQAIPRSIELRTKPVITNSQLVISDEFVISFPAQEYGGRLPEVNMIMTVWGRNNSLDKHSEGKRPDLSGLNFRGLWVEGANLDGFFFAGSDFTDAYFENTSFTGSEFAGAVLTGVQFVNCKNAPAVPSQTPTPSPPTPDAPHPHPRTPIDTEP